MQNNQSIPWIKKYEPNNLNEIIGQDNAVNQIRYFANNYSSSKKKAALLYGNSGTGKTSSIHALAKELNHEIIEMNASDFRNKEGINSIMGNAMKQRSLFFTSKIILIDDIEGLSGQKDRGGLSEVISLIEKSIYPIFITVLNPWDQKFNSLRNKCEMIEFNEIDYKYVFLVLKKICDNENIKYNEDDLKIFSRRVGVDLRAAINDLQTLTNNNIIDSETINEITQRNKTETIKNALFKIFKTTDSKISLEAIENIDEDHEKLMLWIDENLPKEYIKPNDLSLAYDKISRADVFNGRIKRRQHWRFLIYINALLSAGISTSKDEKYKTIIKYVPTQRILKLWKANMKYQKRKSIAQKIAPLIHYSQKDTMSKVLPYLSLMMSRDNEFSKKTSEVFELNKEETDWLKKTI
jgi:replication factor C large subunit